MSIRTDPAVKEAAESILEELGLSMTTAVNIFLRQVIRTHGIPFDVRLTPNETTREAIEEGRRIARDPDAAGYRDMDSLRAALDA